MPFSKSQALKFKKILPQFSLDNAPQVCHFTAMKKFNGQRLKAARLAKKWSIPELAYQVRRLLGIHISETAIRAHEGGREFNPRAQTISAYAAALGMEPGDLFGGRVR